MVVILNYLPFLVFMIAAFYMCSVVGSKHTDTGKAKRILGAALLAGLLIYGWNSASKSYGPKGVVTRSPVPEFEVRDVEVKDRLSKPVPLETRDTDRDAKYQKPLPLGEKDVQ